MTGVGLILIISFIVFLIFTSSKEVTYIKLKGSYFLPLALYITANILFIVILYFFNLQDELKVSENKSFANALNSAFIRLEKVIQIIWCYFVFSLFTLCTLITFLWRFEESGVYRKYLEGILASIYLNIFILIVFLIGVR